MNNLIPEQRADKNGNLVTRHVRATPKQGAGRTVMPQPSLGTSIASKGAKKPFKPREKQITQYNASHNVDSYPFDQRLVTDEEEKAEERARQNRYYSAYYVFKASEVEVYDVLSVAPVGEALRMLSRGVRTADEARTYLTEHGAADLILDRRDQMNEALEKNVSHYDFVSKSESLLEFEKSPHLIDCVRFASSSLNEGLNGTVGYQIASGEISFEDIKAVGITKLKSYDRLYPLVDAFKALNANEGDYTVEGLKELVVRAANEDLKSHFNYVCRLMKEIGLRETLSFKSLDNVANSYLAYKIAPGSNRYGGDALKRAVYSARLNDGLPNSTRSTTFSDQFFDAGIPVETVVDVVSRGGGVREAIAIHEEGIQASVSGGWL